MKVLREDDSDKTSFLHILDLTLYSQSYEIDLKILAGVYSCLAQKRKEETD